MREEWTSAKRLVIKIGSSLLADAQSGALKTDWLASLAADIAAQKQAGREVIVVSSGAIALGRKVLGLTGGALKLEEGQAAAAVGQIDLAHAYEEAFKDHGIIAAQILLTLGDTEERRRYLNARNTIETLLKLGAVPVVNENDTVATSEIRYGDNDRLAARVATMVSADCLVLLSDVNGLYEAPPEPGETGAPIAEVRDITPQIEAMAGDTGDDLSRGGMVTKIEAAKIAVAAGTHLVITSGRVANPIERLAKGRLCTWFPAASDPLAARKRWISGALEPRGVIIVDEGAARALLAGKSLLPAGVAGVEGAFDRGDAVVIKGQDGGKLARGLIAYSSADAARIAGHKSSEIEEILGYRGRTELIHRDDMTLQT